MTSILAHTPNRQPDPVLIPKGTADLASFRRWARSDDFPDHGWISYLAGDILVDLSMETWAHNQVKNEFAVVLTPLVREAETGQFAGDRMRLTHAAAGLSTEPDGMFVSFDSLRDGRVRLTEGAGALEVEGAPDMVLEVISPTSEHKDTVTLRDLYWRAGVKEYWLVDPRDGGDPTFDILRHGARGYTAVRRQAGWLKSRVFGRSFRLTHQVNRAGLPTYTLAVRQA